MKKKAQLYALQLLAMRKVRREQRKRLAEINRHIAACKKQLAKFRKEGP